MTLPEQTGEIAVRCQVGRLQGTLFRIKPVQLSSGIIASVYSSSTVIQITFLESGTKQDTKVFER